MNPPWSEQPRHQLTSLADVVVNRRSFIERMACLGLMTGMPALAAEPRLPWKTAVGLNGFASGERKYGRTHSLRNVLSFIRETGFDGVELVQGWRVGDYPDPDQNLARVEEMMETYKESGLRVFSVQTGAGGAFAPEKETRQQWKEEMRRNLRFARAMGCDCIGMWPGGGLRGQSMDEAIRHVSESFKEIGDMAGELGILAAFEIEPPFVFNTEQHLERILDQTDHPNLKTIYDPSHFDLMNGSQGLPHEMLKRIGVERIGYVHLTDTDGTLRDGGTSKHLACGDGHANIPASLEMLRQGGFEGWIMIDAWEIPDPYDACRMGLHHIQKAMQG